MKTKLFLIKLLVLTLINFSYSQTNLSHVTVGLGIGGNHTFKNVYDYYLTTDGNYNLKRDVLSRSNMVLSSVAVFRFSSLKKDANNKILRRRDNLIDNWDKINLVLSLNLLDTNEGNVSFNKNIDGGIGIGYTLSPNLTISVLYEIQRFRQMRDSVFYQYENNPIPNGNDSFFNALDSQNNDLFHYKSIDGISLKLIFNLETL